MTADPTAPGAPPGASPGAPPGAPAFRRLRLGLAARLRAYFLAGVLVTAPIGITLYLAWIVVAGVDSLIGRILPERYQPETYLPFAMPGLGFVIALAGITVIGAFAAGYMGRVVLRLWEYFFQRTPVLRGIYGATKQIFEAVLTPRSNAFREVVLIEFPRTGMWSIGFVTGAGFDLARRTAVGELVGVYVPTTPNPTSGYLVYIAPTDMVRLPMSIDEGLKLVVSGGLVTPPDRGDEPGAVPAPVSPVQPDRT